MSAPQTVIRDLDPARLTRHHYRCAVCGQMLTGGRDTFGTQDRPLCVDHRWSQYERETQSDAIANLFNASLERQLSGEDDAEGVGA